MRIFLSALIQSVTEAGKKEFLIKLHLLVIHEMYEIYEILI